MLNDRVALAKDNGERHEDIPAVFDGKTIIMEDVTLPIETGDRFERRLPNGHVESYVVLEPGFRESFGGIPSHYETQVRRAAEASASKESAPKADKSVDVFISHSSGDLEFTKLLLALLRSALRLPGASIRCTSVDGHRLPGGADTDEQLRREVHDATAFIGVISVASLNSMYVAFELGARWGVGRHLLPLLTPGADASILSGPLSGLNALRSDNASQLHQLIGDLGSLLKIKPEPAHVFQTEIEALLDVPAPSTPRRIATDSNKLDEVEVNILELLSQLPASEYTDARSLASQIGLSEQRAIYHLKRLVACEFAGDSISIGRPAEYFIAQKGRGILIEQGRL